MTKKRFVIALIFLLLLSFVQVFTKNSEVKADSNIRGARVDETKVSATYYVNNRDKNASDSNDGTTMKTPFKTIGKAVQSALQNKEKKIGTKIIIKEGVYRESLTMMDIKNDAPIILEGEGPDKVIVKGSVVFHDWKAEDEYYTHPWPYDFGVADNIYEDGYGKVYPELMRRREMIFVDGKLYNQVMSLRELKPGGFYIDDAKKMAYLIPEEGIDMDTAEIEVAENERVFFAQSMSNLVYRGMRILHGNPKYYNPGSLDIYRSENVLIENCVIEWSNGIGVNISDNRNVTIKDTKSNYNGIAGYLGAGNKNILFVDSEGSNNNWKGLLGNYTDWASGGIKLLFTYDVYIVRYKAIDNYAPGIWFDSEVRNIHIEDSIIKGNDAPGQNVVNGIYLEGGAGPFYIDNCIVVENKTGITIHSSNNITISNTVIANNRTHQISVFSNHGLGRTFRAFEGGGNVTSLPTDTVIKDTIISAPVNSEYPLFYPDFNDVAAQPLWLKTLKTENVKYYHPNPNRAFLIGGLDRFGSFKQWNSLSDYDHKVDWIPGPAGDLKLTQENKKLVSLSWEPAPGEVAGYKIFRNNILIGETEETTFEDKDFDPDSNFEYSVRAYDEEGNLSIDCNYVLIAKDRDNGKDMGNQDPVSPGKNSFDMMTIGLIIFIIVILAAIIFYGFNIKKQAPKEG